MTLPHLRIWLSAVDEDGLHADTRRLAACAEALESIAARHKLQSLEILPTNVPGGEPTRLLLARVAGPAGELDTAGYHALEEDIYRETGVRLDAVEAFERPDDREFSVGLLNLSSLYDSRQQRSPGVGGRHH